MQYPTSSSFIVLGVALGACASLVACDDGEEGDRYRRHHGDNEIVFGIDETKSTDGKITTSVGYEMLDVLGHGSRARGVVTDESSCWAENLDDRLGQPHVAGGVALFRGGLLPAEGVAVVANRADDLRLDGAAWAHAGDPLTFESKGFVMPDIAPSAITMPSQDLPLTSLGDAASVVPVTTGQDFTLSWAASDRAAPPENVVISLVAAPAGAAPNARGAELRCFFDRTAGKGSVPARLLARFYALLGGGQAAAGAGAPGAATTGRLHVATHSQLTIVAEGGWNVYVVATSEQRDQPFSLTP